MKAFFDAEMKAWNPAVAVTRRGRGLLNRCRATQHGRRRDGVGIAIGDAIGQAALQSNHPAPRFLGLLVGQLFLILDGQQILRGPLIGLCLEGGVRLDEGLFNVSRG